MTALPTTTGKRGYFGSCPCPALEPLQNSSVGCYESPARFVRTLCSRLSGEGETLLGWRTRDTSRELSTRV